MIVVQEQLINVKNKGVYIYQPAKSGKPSGERPSKRRKVSSTNITKEISETEGFVPLLNGDESPECVQLRYNTYKQLWAEQEDRIQVRGTPIEIGD